MKSQKIALPLNLADGYTLNELASIAREAERPSSNPAEAALQAQLLESGALVIRRGWPDFMVLGPGERVRAIEVKEGVDVVRPTQKLLLRVLGKLGVETSVARRRGGDGAWNFLCPCCGDPLDPELRREALDARRDPYDLRES